MRKTTVAEFFIKAIAELRDEERASRNSLLRLNIQSYVERLVKDFRTQFQDGTATPDRLSEEREVLQGRTRRHHHN